MASTLMTVTALSCIILLGIFVQYSQPHEFPKDFVRCRPTDNDCILKRFNDLLHNHPQGYPEIFLNELDPLRLGDIKVFGDPASQANINVELTQVVMHGYSNSTFTKFNGFTNDPKDIKMITESVYPKLVLKGKYKISGKILILPITGEGDFVFTVKNLIAKSRIQPVVEMRDGKKYVKVNDDESSYKLKIKADGLNIHLENLFNNQKDIAENVLKVMNENWELMWDVLESKVNRQVIKANARIINGIMNKIPYNELFIIH